MPLLEIGTILIAIIAWPAIIVVYFWKQISNWYLDRYEKAEPPHRRKMAETFRLSVSMRRRITNNHAWASRFSIESQIIPALLMPLKRSSSCKPVGDVTLISVNQSPMTSIPTKIRPLSRR